MYISYFPRSFLQTSKKVSHLVIIPPLPLNLNGQYSSISMETKYEWRCQEKNDDNNFD